ncbi:MAG: hypothetical protein LBH26_00995 [Treponema sp.]|jgi:hypothetical protein|nr:hypothetical protein [Treponema sp.]
MKSNVYLIRASKNESEALFESVNRVPFFWFALMNTRVIRKLGEEILRLFRKSKTKILGNSNTNIKITKELFLGNARERAVFFKNFFPRYLGLYNDFIAYLDAVFGEDDVLELNIIELSSFGETVKAIGRIRDVVRSVQLGEDPGRYRSVFGEAGDAFSLVGYDRFYRNEFRNFSAEYGLACEKAEGELRERERSARKREMVNRLKSIFRQGPGGRDGLF